MARQIHPLLRWLLCWLILSSTCQAVNFINSDPQIIAAAEAARLNSSLFWTGQPLPGDWSCPCPIQTTFDGTTGSGTTRFTFAAGEVFNWQMSVQGSRAAILSDVIPHEVDHMVRATLVRRPIIRWLDEGCAALFESEAAKAQLRSRAAGLTPGLMTSAWLCDQRYPQESGATGDMYAAGFSLVEYLLTLGAPRKLLEVQKVTGSFPAAFEQIYGFPLVQLPRHWDAWRQGSATEQPNVQLTIWTADWCGPCQQFRRDFNTLPEFHDELSGHYLIRFIDFDRNAAQAQSIGVRSLPAFHTSDKLLTGYTTPDDLLQRLGLLQELQPETTPPTVPSITLPPVANPPAVVPVLPAIEPPPTEREPLAVSPASSVEQISSTSLSPSLLDLVPVGMTLLQLTGVIGGSAMTGGIGGVAVSLLLGWLKFRRARKSSNAEGSSVLASPAPFPRRLDEAGQLLELRQSEGRVPVLDALRGMFLDDELEKLRQSPDPVAQSLAQELQAAINHRVDEVAPLST